VVLSATVLRYRDAKNDNKFLFEIKTWRYQIRIWATLGGQKVKNGPDLIRNIARCTYGQLFMWKNLNVVNIVETLLTGFFEYYSTFYYEFIICPYFGTELSRASFKAKALVGLDLWLTCAYPKAAEHFKVGLIRFILIKKTRLLL
jgi:hypothetical protein